MGIFDKFFGPPNIEKLKEKRDVNALIKALRHKDAAVRKDAALALGWIGAVEPLINVLRSSIQAQNSQVLGAVRTTVRGRTAIQGSELLAAMNSVAPGYESRIKRTIGTLVMIGREAVGPLVNVLDEEVLVPYAVRILVDIGEPSVGPLTEACEKGKSVRSRQNAAEALRQIGGPEAERALAEYRAREK